MNRRSSNGNSTKTRGGSSKPVDPTPIPVSGNEEPSGTKNPRKRQRFSTTSAQVAIMIPSNSSNSESSAISHDQELHHPTIDNEVIDHVDGQEDDEGSLVNSVKSSAMRILAMEESSNGSDCERSSSNPTPVQHSADYYKANSLLRNRALEVVLSHHMLPKDLLIIGGIEPKAVLESTLETTESVRGQRAKIHNELMRIDAALAEKYMTKPMSERYDELSFYPMLYKYNGNGEGGVAPSHSSQQYSASSSSGTSAPVDKHVVVELFHIKIYEDLMLELVEKFNECIGPSVQEQFLHHQFMERHEDEKVESKLLVYHLAEINQIQETFQRFQIIQLCLNIFAKKFCGCFEYFNSQFEYINQDGSESNELKLKDLLEDVNKFLYSDCLKAFDGFYQHLLSFIHQVSQHQPRSNVAIPSKLCLRQFWRESDTWLAHLNKIFAMFASHFERFTSLSISPTETESVVTSPSPPPYFPDELPAEEKIFSYLYHELESGIISRVETSCKLLEQMARYVAMLKFLDRKNPDVGPNQISPALLLLANSIKQGVKLLSWVSTLSEKGKDRFHGNSSLLTSCYQWLSWFRIEINMYKAVLVYQDNVNTHEHICRIQRFVGQLVSWIDWLENDTRQGVAISDVLLHLMNQSSEKLHLLLGQLQTEIAQKCTQFTSVEESLLIFGEAVKTIVSPEAMVIFGLMEVAMNIHQCDNIDEMCSSLPLKLIEVCNTVSSISNKETKDLQNMLSSLSQYESEQLLIENWPYISVTDRTTFLHHVLVIKDQCSSLEMFTSITKSYLSTLLTQECRNLVQIAAFDVLAMLPKLLLSANGKIEGSSIRRCVSLLDTLMNTVVAFKENEFIKLTDTRSAKAKCEVLLRLLPKIVETIESIVPQSSMSSCCLQLMYMIVILINNCMVLHESILRWADITNTPRQLQESVLPSLVDTIFLNVLIAKDVCNFVFDQVTPVVGEDLEMYSKTVGLTLRRLNHRISYSFEAIGHLENVMQRLLGKTSSSSPSPLSDAMIRKLLHENEPEHAVAQYLITIALIAENENNIGNFQLSMSSKLYSALFMQASTSMPSSILTSPSSSGFRNSVEDAIKEIIRQSMDVSTESSLLHLSQDAIYHWFCRALSFLSNEGEVETTIMDVNNRRDAGRCALLVAELLQAFDGEIRNIILDAPYATSRFDIRSPSTPGGRGSIPTQSLRTITSALDLSETKTTVIKRLSAWMHHANQKLSFARKAYDLFLTTISNSNTVGRLEWIRAHCYQCIARTWWEEANQSIDRQIALIRERKLLNILNILDANQPHRGNTGSRSSDIITMVPRVINLAAMNVLFCEALISHVITRFSAYSSDLYDVQTCQHLASSILQRVEGQTLQLLSTEEGMRCGLNIRLNISSQLNTGSPLFLLDWSTLASSTSSNNHMLAYWLAMKCVTKGISLRKLQLSVHYERDDAVHSWIRDQDLAADCLLATCDLWKPLPQININGAMTSWTSSAVTNVLKQLFIFRSNCSLLRVQIATLCLALSKMSSSQEKIKMEKLLSFFYHHCHITIDNVLNSIVDHQSLKDISALVLSALSRSYLLAKVKIRYAVAMIKAILLVFSSIENVEDKLVKILTKENIDGEKLLLGELKDVCTSDLVVSDKEVFAVEEIDETLDMEVFAFSHLFFSIQPDVAEEHCNGDSNEIEIDSVDTFWSELTSMVQSPSSTHILERLQALRDLCMQSVNAARSCPCSSPEDAFMLTSEHESSLKRVLQDMDHLLFGQH